MAETLKPTRSKPCAHSRTFIKAPIRGSAWYKLTDSNTALTAQPRDSNNTPEPSGNDG